MVSDLRDLEQRPTNPRRAPVREQTYTHAIIVKGKWRMERGRLYPRS